MNVLHLFSTPLIFHLQEACSLLYRVLMMGYHSFLSFLSLLLVYASLMSCNRVRIGYKSKVLI